MHEVRLGRTEVRVPAVAVGTWGHGGPKTVGGEPVGWSGADDGLAREALVRAAELGLTHWDTADVYGDGHAEELIGGLWHRVDRRRIFLASKVGWDPGPWEGFYHPHQIRDRLERSLRLLRTEWIDLYYLHHCDFGPGNGRLEGAIELLRRCREEGKIRFIGLSDWSSQKILRYASAVDPDVVQPYRNVRDDGYAGSGLDRWVTAHDAGVAFFSPLKHGLLLGGYLEPPVFEEGDHRRRIAEFRDPAVLDHLRDCGERVRRRFAGHPQPVLHALVGALLTGQPSACVLLGARRPEHVAAAATLGEPLSAEDAEWVRRLYRAPAGTG